MLAGKDAMYAIRLATATLIVLALSPFAFGNDKVDQAAKDELAKLQGQWKVVSFVNSGQTIDEIARLELVFEFKDQSLTVRANAAPNFTPQQRVLRLTANTTPKLLDFAENDKALAERRDVIEGVYALDGDSLQLCLKLDGGKAVVANRPAAVESKEGSGVALFKLERMKN
jgi:uncharacterized protein (TIGR03067 family)